MGVKYRTDLFRMRGVPWALSFLGTRHYRNLTEIELSATRKSDTIFIFGSGYSINDISDDEWALFESHDTMSFNWFMRQRMVRIDYHLIREVGEDDRDPSVWRPKILEYANLIAENALYAQTIFLVQKGWRAINGNRLVGMKLLPESARVFRFRNRLRTDYERPASSFREGLSHGASTLTDCLNFAYILGWRQVVLVGVDLYDRRYFWLGKDETLAGDIVRGSTHEERHNAADGLVNLIRGWNGPFQAEGVQLSVYNPRSLLASVLPTTARQGLSPNRKA